MIPFLQSLIRPRFIELTNSQVFDTPGATTWTVPAGVTEIWAKCWGAGAGGVGAWGGGGGYIWGAMAVTPGEVLDILLGAGLDSTYPAQAVETSVIPQSNPVPTRLIIALGGKAYDPDNPTEFVGGQTAIEPGNALIRFENGAATGGAPGGITDTDFPGSAYAYGATGLSGVGKPGYLLIRW
jgi:trimeric autotransporter adhesin